MLSGVKDRQSLHMPAHHGAALFYYDPIALDTTELPDTDNLYQPFGAIAEAQQLLALSAGVQSAHFLHNGSTAGIQAMLLYARHRGGKILMQRSSHISVYHFAAVLGLEAVYVKDSFTEEGIPYLDTEHAVACVRRHPDASAILLTSPNYYGVCVDIARISAIARQEGVLVLVDQAHGAHLNWSKSLKNAREYGADIFVQSAHKTLPCATSCAWLLNKTQDADLLLKCLQSVQTTSPSFTNMLMMDDARAYMDANAALDKILSLIESFGRRVAHLGYHLTLEELERQGHIVDKTRLVLDCPQGGYAVRDVLSKCGIDVEMVDARRIVCILSLLPKVCKQELQTLYFGLMGVAYQERSLSVPADFIPQNTIPEAAVSLQSGYYAAKERIPLHAAIGRSSADIIGLYPPGTPLIVWGERFTAELVHVLESADPRHVVGVEAGRVYVIKE